MLLPVLVSCAGETLIEPNPHDAVVRVGGEPLRGNVLRYGRWIGNVYDIEVSAPYFKTQHVRADVALGNRAGGFVLGCVGTVIGIPLVPAVFWNGELENPLYVSLEPEPRGAGR